jgi:hypothetical protein
VSRSGRIGQPGRLAAIHAELKRLRDRLAELRRHYDDNDPPGYALRPRKAAHGPPEREDASTPASSPFEEGGQKGICL